jgi:hypothetical protein
MAVLVGVLVVIIGVACYKLSFFFEKPRNIHYSLKEEETYNIKPIICKCEEADNGSDVVG